MTRKEFLSICSLLGLSIPLQAGIPGLGGNGRQVNSRNFEGKVLIIGAGAAGLTAGYLLNQLGIDFQILEASSVYGGRMKRTTDFVDFPIPLGAEWIHVEKDILEEIVNDSAIKVDVPTKAYDPEVDYGLFEGKKISMADGGFKLEQKFINSTWFDFFDQYIVPTVKDKISFNEVVRAIDYSEELVNVKTTNQEYTADHVFISIPPKMLQKGSVDFIPALPPKKLKALNSVTVWDGCKAFIEFTEKFYPTYVIFGFRPASAGQKLFYDASYGQHSSRNVLGLFAVGEGTKPYVDLSDEDLISHILVELDEIFEGKASPAYVKHIFQNWNKEPFIQGAYINDRESWRKVRRLGKSVDDKLFFTGTSYTDGEDWGSVHTAARSAKRAVEELMGLY